MSLLNQDICQAHVVWKRGAAPLQSLDQVPPALEYKSTFGVAADDEGIARFQAELVP